MLLASCAAPRLKPDSSLLAAQAQRERELSVHSRWSLAARLAISGPQDGGSGSLAWAQDGSEYRFAVSAPVTGKTWTLSGDGERAEHRVKFEQRGNGDKEDEQECGQSHERLR